MKGEVNDTLRDRVHAPCTLKSESVHGECKEVCTRLHACTPRKTHAHLPLQSLQDGSNQAAPTPPAGYTPRTSQSTSIQSVYACRPNRGIQPPPPKTIK